MRVLYVRHGKSMANANLTIGVPDTLLAEEGIEQARITGQDLRMQNVTAIVCSPFIRAQQTAEIIAGELGIDLRHISVIQELHERRMGKLEGGPRSPETIPQEYFFDNDHEQGFESQADLISRTKTAVEKVRKIAATTPGTVVVVGHAVSGFYFLQVAKGYTSYDQFEPSNQMGNAEFIEVTLKD